MKPATTAEILITVIARLLRGSRHVVAGAQSPVPGAAALLAKSLGWGVERVPISIWSALVAIPIPRCAGRAASARPINTPWCPR